MKVQLSLVLVPLVVLLTVVAVNAAPPYRPGQGSDSTPDNIGDREQRPGDSAGQLEAGQGDPVDEGLAVPDGSSDTAGDDVPGRDEPRGSMGGGRIGGNGRAGGRRGAGQSQTGQDDPMDQAGTQQRQSGQEESPDTAWDNAGTPFEGALQENSAGGSTRNGHGRGAGRRRGAGPSQTGQGDPMDQTGTQQRQSGEEEFPDAAFDGAVHGSPARGTMRGGRGRGAGGRRGAGPSQTGQRDPTDQAGVQQRQSGQEESPDTAWDNAGTPFEGAFQANSAGGSMINGRGRGAGGRQGAGPSQTGQDDPMDQTGTQQRQSGTEESPDTALAREGSPVDGDDDGDGAVDGSPRDGAGRGRAERPREVPGRDDPRGMGGRRRGGGRGRGGGGRRD